MNIGVIGTGDIGEVIIRKLSGAGYPVKMANGSEDARKHVVHQCRCYLDAI